MRSRSSTPDVLSGSRKTSSTNRRPRTPRPRSQQRTACSSGSQPARPGGRAGLGGENMERQQLAEQLFKVLFGRQSTAQYVQTRVNSDRDALQSDMLTQLGGDERVLALQAEGMTPWKEVGE